MAFEKNRTFKAVRLKLFNLVFVYQVLEGAADFFTFGMISSMRKLSAEVNANRKLLDMLGKAENYYNLTHDKDGRGVWLKIIIIVLVNFVHVWH